MPLEVLSAERLREVLDYDPATGKFSHRITGKRSFAANGKGYVTIWIDGRSYSGHRLAWLYVHGEWPDGWLDHVNCNRVDNRLVNLRVAGTVGNAANRRISRHNTTGLKGVSYSKEHKRWFAQITVRKRKQFLGYFDAPEEAHQAYLKAAKSAFGEFARAG